MSPALCGLTVVLNLGGGNGRMEGWREGNERMRGLRTANIHSDK